MSISQKSTIEVRGTVEFLGIRKQLHESAFNPIEFDGIKIQTGFNGFILNVKPDYPKGAKASHLLRWGLKLTEALDSFCYAPSAP